MMKQPSPCPLVRLICGVQLKVLVNQHPPEPVAPSLPSPSGRRAGDEGSFIPQSPAITCKLFDACASPTSFAGRMPALPGRFFSPFRRRAHTDQHFQLHPDLRPCCDLCGEVFRIKKPASAGFLWRCERVVSPRRPSAPARPRQRPPKPPVRRHWRPWRASAGSSRNPPPAPRAGKPAPPSGKR